MRLYALTAMAALAATVCFRPDDGAGSGSGPGPGSALTPPVENDPALSLADPAPAAAAKPAKAPKAPKAAKAAPGDTTKVHIVWCSPGHAQYGLGMMLRGSADLADGLRGAGHARVASEEEVAAYIDRKAEILDLD